MAAGGTAGVDGPVVVPSAAGRDAAVTLVTVIMVVVVGLTFAFGFENPLMYSSSGYVSGCLSGSPPWWLLPSTCPWWAFCWGRGSWRCRARRLSCCIRLGGCWCSPVW